MPTATTAVAFGVNRIEPLAGGHRLVGRRIVAEPAPIAFALEFLVRDGSLDDQDERIQFAAVGFEEPGEKVVGTSTRPALEVDEGPMDRDLGQAG